MVWVACISASFLKMSLEALAEVLVRRCREGEYKGERRIVMECPREIGAFLLTLGILLEAFGTMALVIRAPALTCYIGMRKRSHAARARGLTHNLLDAEKPVTDPTQNRANLGPGIPWGRRG